MALIQLGGHRNGRPAAAWAIVDDEDAEWLERWRWSYIDGYAARGARPADGHTGLVLMHRAICGLARGDGIEVDHINRNRIDNRRGNLRVGPHAMNCQNVPSRGTTSRFRGVRLNRGRWQAYSHVDGGFTHLGVYSDEETAARVASEFRAAHMPYAVEAVAS